MNSLMNWLNLFTSLFVLTCLAMTSFDFLPTADHRIARIAVGIGILFVLLNVVLRHKSKR
jgi:hypothetical protein